MPRTFEYFKADTFIHKLSPLSKALYLLLTTALALLCNFIEDVVVMVVWLIIGLIFLYRAKISVKSFSFALKIMSAVFLFIIITQGFMYRDHTPLFIIGHLKIWGGADIGVFTLEGLLFGISVVIRILMIIVAVPILTMTTSPAKLIALTQKLKIPYKYAFMVLSAIRFTPVVYESWERISDAQKLRALDIDSMNIINKARKAYIPIITPLVLSLFRNALDLEVAIQSRGFGAPAKRTSIEEVKLTRNDYIFITIVGIMTFLFIYVKLYYEAWIWQQFLNFLGVK
jgi:energy-coupling factor transport system permease protein